MKVPFIFVFVILIACCIASSCCFLFVVTKDYWLPAILEITGPDKVCDKYFNDAPGLFNLNGNTVFQIGHESPEALITSYPWVGQYFFMSPGEPYCYLNFDRIFQNFTVWKLFIPGEPNQYIEGNITYRGEITDPNISVYYNAQAYIVIEKRGDLYYSKGVFGYTLTP